MTASTQWHSKLDELCTRFDETLLTAVDFERSLGELLQDPTSPLDRVACRLTRPAPFQDLSFGFELEADPGRAGTFDQFDQNGTKCILKLWPKAYLSYSGKVEDLGRVFEAIKSLIQSFWKPHLRDRFGLISLQYPHAYQLADKFLMLNRPLTSFFIDLDNFGQVNNKISQARGDQVITAFASVVETSIGPGGIAIHRSGDEFVVLNPCTTPDQALLIARNVMEGAARYDFSLGAIRIGAKVGIAVVDAEEPQLSFKTLEERAEMATKPGGIKQRGKARFEQRAQNVPPPDTQDTRGIAFLVMRTSIASKRPFESPWLNMLSDLTVEFIGQADPGGVDLNSKLNGVLTWMDPEFDASMMRSALPLDNGADFVPRFSLLDVGLAAAHGIFRAYFDRQGPQPQARSLMMHFRPDALGCELCLQPNGTLLLEVGERDGRTESWDLGGFVSQPSPADQAHVTTQRALLVRIGHSQLQIPTSIFNEVITVDDRPTRGGGLPDFWEATIARLVARINANSNISSLYVIGNEEWGAQTVRELRSVESWNSRADLIEYKTGMPSKAIRIAADRLMGKIRFVATEQELLPLLLDLHKPGYCVEPLSSPVLLQKGTRFLDRQLRMDNRSLGSIDGCRVKTVAEAFPVAVEIARHSTSEDTIRDQEGQELRELIDFKIHLADPSSAVVPAFYANEETSLDEYYKKEFLSECGLFGRAFKETGQLEAVLAHLVRIISDPTRRFATRRAILVVPHTIVPGEELSPLGLVSIRIIPRFSQTRTRLHFSYTWRTVETLVGLPYSLYGSVRFSQHLTERVRNRLPDGLARLVEMGEVSYIANSLHIFLDDYGQNIAKRIVDDASN